MSSTTQTHTHTSSEHHDLLILHATDAIDMASLGASCVSDLRAVLQAIMRLSRDDNFIHDLARVGFQLAGDRHDVLDCEHQAMKSKLLALMGASHV